MTRHVLVAVLMILAACGGVTEHSDAGEPMTDGGPPSHAAYCLANPGEPPSVWCQYRPASDSWSCGPCSTCMEADGGATCFPRP